MLESANSSHSGGFIGSHFSTGALRRGKELQLRDALSSAHHGDVSSLRGIEVWSQLAFHCYLSYTLCSPLETENALLLVPDGHPMVACAYRVISSHRPSDGLLAPRDDVSCLVMSNVHTKIDDQLLRTPNIAHST